MKLRNFPAEFCNCDPEMDFLYSFRLNGEPFPLKPSKPIEGDDSNLYLNAYTRFLFLTVDNTWWKFCQTYGIVIRFILATYTIGFDDENTIILYLGILLDIFYLIDFISAVVYRCNWPKGKKPEKLKSEVGRLVWRNKMYKPRPIWMLFLDAVSLLPFRLVRIWDKSLPIFYLTYCNPSLRLVRFICFYVENMENIFLRSTVILELILKFTVLWVVTNHFFTILYFSYVKSANTAYLEEATAAISFRNESFQWYLIVFYTTQFALGNIGFGDIMCASDGERVITIFIVIVGFALLNGYLISALSNSLGEKARRMVTLRLRMSLMKSELSNSRVPDEVIKKVEKFYGQLYVSRNGVGSDLEVFVPLPDSLMTRIYTDIYFQALNASVLFRSCDEFSKRAIAQIMKSSLYMSGDVILKRNELNSEMLYVRKGTVEVMSYQDDETQIVAFGAGSILGQIGLLLSIPAKSEVHAATFCEIFTIRRKDLFLTLRDYPQAKEIIFNVHRNLLLNALADKFKRKSSDSTESENVLPPRLFYLVPLEASKISQNDICVVNVCPFVFEPNTTYCSAWCVFLSIIIVIIGFYYPYCATFERKYPKLREPFIVIIDILLMLNIYFEFSTAFMKENVLVSSPRDIVIRRLESFSTYLDLIAVFPIHYCFKDHNRTKSFILCMRCLELYKIYLWFRKAEKFVSLATSGFLRLIKYVLNYFLINYVVGVTYYLEACYNIPCVPDSWYPRNNASATCNSPIWVSLYIGSLMVSGTGYGDITAKNIRDVIFVIAFTTIGSFMFIFLISEYSAYLSLFEGPKQQFMDFVDRVNSFLVQHKMMPSVRLRVRQFLNMQWEINRGYVFINSGTNIFYDTPAHLLNEIKQYTKSRGIHNMELFKHFSKGVLQLVLSKLTKKLFPPHEVVIYGGEVCSTIFVIEEGFCEVSYGKDSSLKKIVGPGHDLCTVEVLLGLSSLCNIRTLTHCTVIKIDRDHLMASLQSNTIAYEEFNKFLTDFKNTPIFQEIQKYRPPRLHLMVRPSALKSVHRFRNSRKEGTILAYKRPFLKLGLCQYVRFVLLPVTILPYGKLLKVWELFRCLFAFLTAMLFPLLPFYELQVPALKYVAYFLDFTAWIDMYFRAHVGYYNKLNVMVTHPLCTCSHYLKGNFIIDFLACFPFDRIMFRRVYNTKGQSYVTNRVISILRLLRVLQIYRIVTTIPNLGEDVLTPPSFYCILIMMVLLTIVFLNFLASALILYCVNYLEDKHHHYVMVIRRNVRDVIEMILTNYHLSQEPFTLYLVILYWVTQTAVALGFGDITAGNNRDLMIYVIIVIILSYLYFGYVTIVIASFLTRTDMNLTMYQQRMSSLVKFLKAENVETLLRKHIINHFEYTWEKQKGLQADTVISNFNRALKEDVFLYLYEEVLKNVGAFANTEGTTLRVISGHLTEVHFISGAGIYKTGDIISDVYIVHSGEVTLVGKNEDETVTIGPSMLFGHFDNVPRGIPTLSAVATKNVTVLTIKTTILYSIFQSLDKRSDETWTIGQQKLKDALMNSNQLNPTSKKVETPDYKTTIQYWIYKFSKTYMILYVILSYISINEVSYNAAFESETYKFTYYLVPVEFMFLVKIYLGFNTGYLDASGDFVSNRRSIARRYLLKGFYVDVFTVFPFEIFALALKKKDRTFGAVLFRMTKFLRARNIQAFFSMKFDTLSVNIMFLKITMVLIWSTTLIHQCTCFWYFISCFRGDCTNSRTWNRTMDGDFHDKYVASLYFVAVVLTTTGFGDVVPYTLLEFSGVIFLSFVGFFFTAIFIGQIISTVQKCFLAKTDFQYAIQTLKTYLHVNDIPEETQKMILKYIGNLWRNENGEEIPVLLKDAPPYLINEIKQTTYSHHINNNPVFGHCNEFFRKQLMNKLQRKVFFPGNIVVNEGEVNRTVFFVHSGLVESKDLRDVAQRKLYGKNTFFGLKQGVMQREPHTMTFTAKTFTIILSLKLEKWEFLSEFYPDDIKYIREHACVDE